MFDLLTTTLPVVTVLRPMRLADVALLERWDGDPELNAQLGGRGADWYDWELELERAAVWRELLMIEHDRRTVGFVQLLDAAADEEHYWGEVDAGTWAVDMWIGAATDRGRGIGAAAMEQALRCGACTVVLAWVKSADATALRRLKPKPEDTVLGVALPGFSKQFIRVS